MALVHPTTLAAGTLAAAVLAGCSGSGGKAGGSEATGHEATTSTDDDDTAEVPFSWGAVSFDPDATPPDALSDLHLVRWTGSELEYNVGLVPYSLRTPLFSDFAAKDRAVWMPEGTAAQWVDGTVLDFPVGTVLLKTFLLSPDLREPLVSRRVVETRLLIRGTEKWHAWPYLWAEDGSDAELHVAGEVFDHTFVDTNGHDRTAHYLVPQRNQCVDCHETFDPEGERVLRPLGPEPWLVHDGTFLESLVASGQLTGAPDLSTVVPATDWSALEARGVADLTAEETERAARDYLHVNCAHCHSPTGIEGVTSQFFLDRGTEEGFHLGVCKRPGSAGEGGEDREFDIVPGDPQQSILWYRTATEDVGAMMPDIGRSLTHDIGAELIWRWIGEMDPVDCDGTD